MPTAIGDRRRVAHQLESIGKRADWRSVALVGVRTPEVLQRLAATLRRAKLVVIATWEEPDDRPGSKMRLAGAQSAMRRAARAYSGRVTLLETTPEDGLELVGDDTRFDAVALLGVESKELAGIGERWKGHVAPGGTLLGTDCRLTATRKALKEWLPEHERLDDGLWSAKVAGERVPEKAPEKTEAPPEKAQVPEEAPEEAPEIEENGENAPEPEAAADLEAAPPPEAEDPKPARRRGRPKKDAS